MHLLAEIFGQGKDLTTIQMSCRGVVVFFIALLLIRLSGRRSFGIHSPLDNIITIARNRTVERLVEGKKILLYQDGRFKDDDTGMALVCKEDVLQGVRKSALTDDLGKIDRIYMEKNGEISAIKKG